MTYALADLGPRIDATPVAAQGSSSTSAASGAAFAEAVDAAVVQAQRETKQEAAPAEQHRDGKRGDSPRDERSAPDAPSETDHHRVNGHEQGDRQDSERRGRHESKGPKDDALQLMWAVMPHTLPHSLPHAALSAIMAPHRRSADAVATVAQVGTLPAQRHGAGHIAATTGEKAAAAATPFAKSAALQEFSQLETQAGSAKTGPGAKLPAPPAPASAPSRATGVAEVNTTAAGKAAPVNTNADMPTATTASVTTTAITAAASAPAETKPAGTVIAQAAQPEGLRTQVTPAHAQTAHLEHARTLAAHAQATAAASAQQAASKPSETAGHLTALAVERPAPHKARTEPANRPAATQTDATASAPQPVSPTAVHVPTVTGSTVNSAPAVTAPPVPAPPPALAQPEVATILAQLRGAADGTYQLRAKVHPAELGAVSITATVSGGTLHVLLSPDQTAQQAISDSLTQLRDHLADQGFTGVDVGLGSPQQSPDRSGQGRGENDTHTQGSDHTVGHGQGSAIEGATPVRRHHADSLAALDQLL